MQQTDAPQACLLTISCPGKLEEEFIDLFREHRQWVSGFTSLPAEGFGTGTRLHTSMEQVRGRSQRRIMQLVLDMAHVEPLLGALRQQIPSSEVAWWTIPVSGFGRFG